MEKRFAVRWEYDGRWQDVFPGLTGDYAWALKVAYGTWNRNGYTVTPEMMRICEVEGGIE